MAVYTEVDSETLATFLTEYAIGDLVSCKGIAEGVENSNFLIHTSAGVFILTIYEKRVRPEDLPFFLALLDHLADKGTACPRPIHGRDGQALRHLMGKPAAIVSFLEGVSVRRPKPEHCAEVGRAMAKLHLNGASFGQRRRNDLSVEGWKTLAQACQPLADGVRPGLAKFILDEITFLEGRWPTRLPVGTIHADLFPDNVFFIGDRVSGLIDFYFACTDTLAYDLAIGLNAWCFELDHAFNVTKARQLLAAYREVRPLSPDELAALPLLARGAALRFLLTRLYDWLHQVEGALVRPKDPLEYSAKLRFHQAVQSPAAYGLS
ncbi:MAG: homoserine kinase [Alphaproteobacteria bacterium]|nr:homoserine kinase [Alphaproteobacteria bacterium]